MKRYFLFVPLALFFASCGEPYKSIDPKEFNDMISKRTDIRTPSALIHLYYPTINDGVEPTTSIETKSLGGGEFEIIMVSEHLGDDSQQAEKIIMMAHDNGNTWTVNEIRLSWKCYEGRGSTNWNATPCN
jgi:hypothetical protein